MAALIAVSLLLASAVPAGAQGAGVQRVALPANPEVQAAEERLLEAEDSYADTAARLDRLAEEFEDARGHAERLGDELGDADDALGAAQAAVDLARETRRAQVRAAYKQPGVALLRTSGALLFAPDAETALHASTLMAHVAVAQAREAEQLRVAGQRVADNIRNQRGIATGTAAAMQDLQNLAAIFEDALAAAADEVGFAEDALAEAEERAEQQALAGQAPISYAGIPVPVVREATINGGTQYMTCPLGQPNGFIDSWGFPRSGGRTHKGVDMFAAYGMPVFAAADGYIRRVFNNRLGGLSIDLVDSLGNRYYYAHLSAAYVTDFQSVRVGELIAANGNSGNAISTPPHVHWQFHPGDGGPVNPFPLAAALCR